MARLNTIFITILTIITIINKPLSLKKNLLETIIVTGYRRFAYRKRSGIIDSYVKKSFEKQDCRQSAGQGTINPRTFRPGQSDRNRTRRTARRGNQNQSIAGTYRAVGTYTQNNRPAVLRQQAGCFHLHTKEVTRRSG